MDDPLSHPYIPRFLSYIAAGKHDDYGSRLISRAFGVYVSKVARVLAALEADGQINFAEGSTIDTPINKRRYVAAEIQQESTTA